MTTFAENLKAARARAGLTQAGLATASGLGLGTIRDYEQGSKEPMLRSAMKLAQALGVAVEQLAGNDVQAADSKPAKKHPAAKASKPARAMKGKKSGK